MPIVCKPPSRAGSRPFDVRKVRLDFPALHQEIHGKPLVYLDNAATSQTPLSVMEAVRSFYAKDRANIHRGVHLLSQRATERYEEARKKVSRFLNAPDAKEIVFVRGATEGINLVAQSFGHSRIRAGDEILVSAMEHHSNIVPWQFLCRRTGAILRVAPMDDRGEMIVEEYEKLLGPRTKLVALAQVSNALGTVNPVRELIDLAHGRGIPVLLDGAQAAPHVPVDLQALDCDFYVLSGHKMFGPTGIGVLFGKRELLEEMPPWQGGGDMILSVSFEKTVVAAIPHKFEAGTPNIAGGIGLGAAVDYIEALDFQAALAHEEELLRRATAALEGIDGIRVIGTARHKAGVLSFLIRDAHPHDVGTILDREGIAIRAGHHCAEPVMRHFGIPATTRASFAFYNTHEEVDALVAGIAKVKEIFGR